MENTSKILNDEWKLYEESDEKEWVRWRVNVSTKIAIRDGIETTSEEMVFV